MALPTAAEITRLYLYGSTAIPNLVDAQRIRPPVTPTNVVGAPAVDVNDYMDNGPGRFVNAASFEVVVRFFSSFQVIPPSPAAGYTKDDLFALFGMAGGGPSQLARRAAFIRQSDFADGTDDLLERSYIWQSTGFQIDGRARFFVDANGTRRIENFGIIPFSSQTAITPANTENFDLIGGGPVTNFINGLLKPLIDPNGIGRTINIPFTQGIRTLRSTSFTSADFDAAVASLVPATTLPNLARIRNGANQFTQQLFNDGAIRLLDPQSRPILYGSDRRDVLSGTTSVDGVDISKPVTFFLTSFNQPLASFTGNGIAYITGSGSDTVTGTSAGDFFMGGRDDDRLSGGAGNDEYRFDPGDGRDTITDSDGLGRIQLVLKHVNYET